MAQAHDDTPTFIDRFSRPPGSSSGPRGRFPTSIVVVVAIVAFALGFIIPTPGSVVHIVYAGHVGVKAIWGRVQGEALQPGVYFLNPIADRIFDIDVRVLPHNFKEIDAASKEYQSVKLTGTMNYHIQGDKAPYLYQTVGTDFVEKVIDPAFADFVKEVVPQYAATDILGKRDEIRQRARDALGKNIERYGVTVDDVYLSDITFSPEYQAAIERKQTAQQQVEAERQVLAQKGVQADQAVVEARGKADARVAAALGDAKGNQLLTESLSAQLIDYLRWTRWDGRLPQVTGGSGTLISVPLPTAVEAGPAAATTAGPGTQTAAIAATPRPAASTVGAPATPPAGSARPSATPGAAP
jgi:regulator of protease activity HflC (stomatin/prohibitin superfamily)